MIARWYAINSIGRFSVGANGLPYAFYTLQEAMDEIPYAYSYITHAGARKIQDDRFDWYDFGYLRSSELPF